MTKLKVVDTSEIFVNSVVDGIQEVKGHEIVILDLREIPHAVTDFFVICHGTSNTQVEAITRSIEDTVETNHDERVWQKEGLTNAEWALLDFGNVVVHVFYKEARQFYALEELWADAKVTLIEAD
ncbi:MAG: ribosome silencing factor [Flavobacteriales bacterium]|nr:ribosome silencing factor [Flavobacteriales bacterium]